MSSPRKVSPKPRHGKKAAPHVPELEIRLPLPPVFPKRFYPAELERSYQVMEQLHEYDRARGHLRALRVSLRKLGIELQGLVTNPPVKGGAS